MRSGGACIVALAVGDAALTRHIRTAVKRGLHVGHLTIAINE